MKNVKKILYVLFMTMSFLSFVACSDDSGGGGGPAVTPIDTYANCSTCPSGFGVSLNTSAIGKDYSAYTGAERAQLVLNFFGASGQTFGGGQVAANGIFYANQNFFCAQGTLPVGTQFQLQTVQLGTMTGTDWIQGLVLQSGNIEIRLPSIRIGAIPMSVNVVDITGRAHTRSVETLLQADIYIGGQYCNRMALGIQY